MAGLDAGRLRHRISLTDVGEQTTARGGSQPTPVMVAHRIPAEVMPLAGTALMRAQQIDPRSQYTVTTRWRPNVSARLKLTYHSREGDKTFEILNVNDLEELHYGLALTCREAS